MTDQINSHVLWIMEAGRISRTTVFHINILKLETHIMKNVGPIRNIFFFAEHLPLFRMISCSSIHREYHPKLIATDIRLDSIFSKKFSWIYLIWCYIIWNPFTNLVWMQRWMFFFFNFRFFANVWTMKPSTWTLHILWSVILFVLFGWKNNSAKYNHSYIIIGYFVVYWKRKTISRRHDVMYEF